MAGSPKWWDDIKDAWNISRKTSARQPKRPKRRPGTGGSPATVLETTKPPLLTINSASSPLKPSQVEPSQIADDLVTDVSDTNNTLPTNNHTNDPISKESQVVYVNSNNNDITNPDLDKFNSTVAHVTKHNANDLTANKFNAYEVDAHRIDTQDHNSHAHDLNTSHTHEHDPNDHGINHVADKPHDATRHDANGQDTALDIAGEGQFHVQSEHHNEHPLPVRRRSENEPANVPIVDPSSSVSKRSPKPWTQVQSLKDEEMTSTPGGSKRSSISDSQVWKESTMEVDGKEEPEVLSIAAEIGCRPVVYMCGERLLSNEVFPITWLAEGQYKAIRKIIVGRIKAELKRIYGKGQWPKPYRLSADVRLLLRDDKGVEKQLESDAVHHQGHWAQKVPVLVARHGSRNPFSKLLLEVVWHYDTIDVHAQQGRTLAQKICKAVLEKRKRNWRYQWFLSTADLDAIFSEEIIRELINNDESLTKELMPPSLPRSDDALQRWTPEWLFLNASGLLATCIWARLPLSCLRQLVIDHDTTDVDRPLIAAPAAVDEVEFDALVSKQKMFWVYNFDEAELKKQMERGTYEVIENWQTVPIVYKGPLGEGGFGLVSEVSIYPGHHTFKEVSSYASKHCFRD